MNGRNHLLVAFFVFVGLYLKFESITLSMIPAPIVVTLYPDIDLKLGSHRNWFFHSIILWVIVAACDPGIRSMLFVVSTGIHLVCDITPRPSKWSGYYCLKWWKRGIFRHMSIRQGVMSTAWYFFNFVFAFGLLLIQLNS